MSLVLHPWTVHFPIALLLCGSALELWRSTHRDDHQSSQLLLRWGWWSALLTTLTGIVDAATHLEQTQRLLGWINSHGLAGILVVAVYWRLVAGRPLPAPSRRRWLWVGIGLIVLTAALGGQLVYYRNWLG